MKADTIIDGARLLVTLGFEVYRAIREGNRTKTVGEIFDGVGTDMAELERLELERFGDED